MPEFIAGGAIVEIIDVESEILPVQTGFLNDLGCCWPTDLVVDLKGTVNRIPSSAGMAKKCC